MQPRLNPKPTSPDEIKAVWEFIGFRNRLLVLINWVWDYFFYERAVRLILPSATNTALSLTNWYPRQKAVRLKQSP